MIIGKNLGFDIDENCALCSQLNQYKEGKAPFDFPVEYGFDEPTNWWNIIETKPQLELDAETYMCRNMFGFGNSQNLVSELSLFAEIPNPKPVPKSEIDAEIRNR